MADDQPDQSEKTEDPSQKKIQDALERGDVAKSQELSSFFVLAGATLVVFAFAGSMASGLSLSLQNILVNAHAIGFGSGDMALLLEDLSIDVMITIGFPLLILMVMAVFGNLVQHAPVLSVEPVTPKLSKVSPIAGFKRLFSKESLMNFLKGLFKISLISIVVIVVLWPDQNSLNAILYAETPQIMPLVHHLAVKLLGGALAVMFVLGIADFAWVKHQWWERQKMTMQEVKDEYKQQEGDPMVKAKLRQIRQERSRRRMMAAVPDATVVVTNPTHYAVALKYDNSMPAPVCLAKGVDMLAVKMRQVARDHDVPLVENPPLARSLYAMVEIDQEIPPEHYKAVADVIGFVMRMRDKKRFSR
jgi:flagellar biosynthetic protein FlhB